MPLSAAEKQARYRARLKATGQYAAYKIKNAAHSVASRARDKDRINQLPEDEKENAISQKRQATAQRVQKHREKDTPAGTPAAAAHPFGSSSSFAKAVNKARRTLEDALPPNEERRTAVKRRLAETFNVGLSELQQPVAKPVPGPTALPDHVKDLVVTFYRREDISRLSPRTRDRVIVDGDVLQARHLYGSIGETYELFKEEFEDVPIKRSKFFELRPLDVLLVTQLPVDVCLCIHHEECALLVEGIRKVLPALPKFSSEMVDKLVCVPCGSSHLMRECGDTVHSVCIPVSLVCENPTKDCWINKCELCQSDTGLKQYFLNCDKNYAEILDSPVKVFEWSQDSGRLVKVERHYTLRESIQKLHALLPNFVRHCRAKRRQASCYNKCKEATIGERSRAMIQLDFAENYTCISQDQVQSAYYSQAQVSVLTATTWVSGRTEPFSTVICSDVKDHTKTTVVPYVHKLLLAAPRGTTHVDIWSDGPSAQFKNRYVAAAVPVLEKHHSVKITWNFFASSHGKGPCDGLGGSVKRMVRTKVLARKALVFDAASFVEAAESQSSNVVKILMTNFDFSNISESLNLDEVFSSAPELPGIKACHQIRFENGKAELRPYSDYERSTEASVPAIPSGTYRTGGWVRVRYDDQEYVGQILDRSGMTLKVRCLETAGGGTYKFETENSAVWYHIRKDVIGTCPAPTLVNARGIYKL